MSLFRSKATRVAAISAAMAAAVLSFPLAGGSGAERDDELPTSIGSWAFAIGDGTLSGRLSERYAGFDLVVVDGEEARPADVRRIGSGGALVLGYLSVGTIERWRSWYDRIKRFRLAANRDWKDEWYADVSRRGYRRQVAGRIAPALLAKGFDGLFLDNTDTVEARKRLRGGMERLVSRLAKITHDRSGLLFTQNGAGVTESWIAEIDGWNREDVSATYDFNRDRYRKQWSRTTRVAVRELRRFAAEGILVTTTDYTRRADSALAREARARACRAGALPYVSDIGLRRVPAEPAVCP